MFCDLWMSPVYELWLEEAVSLGEVEAPDYYDNVYAYARCKWIGPPRGWVDPVKEATSAQIRMDANISTLQDECAEQGQDWEEVLEQKATEMQKKTELGLPLTADANVAGLVKALPPDPPEPADLEDQKVDVQPPEGS
jgi:capsid protein